MRDPQKTRRALGKGLGALIPEPAETAKPTEAGESVVLLDLDLIVPNSLQPRKSFDPDELRALAQSLTEQGVISPIVVRESGGRFEIVTGERRWRAAQLAGMQRIPAVVRNYHREKVLEIALVENIQRAGLNPIEEAQGYRMLLEEFQIKQEEIARRVGKDRSSVSNTLRLLKLSASLQSLVIDGKLSAGHARALLAVEDEGRREKLGARAVKDGLSVRDVERLVSALERKARPGTAESKAADAGDIFLRQAQEKLQHVLGTKVRIEKSANGGRISIEFYSDEELMRLFDRLVK